MSLLRQSTLTQLKRLNSEIKKQGGDVEKASDSEKNMANQMWVHDPISSDTSGKRKIATYDQMYSIDIPDPTKKELKMKNEHVISFDNYVMNEKNSIIDLGENFQKITYELSKNLKEHKKFDNRLNDIEDKLDNMKITLKKILNKL